jgi:hypothetical protein
MANSDSHIILDIEKTQVYIMPAGRLCRNNFALGKKNPTLSICTLLKLPHRTIEKLKLELPIKSSIKRTLNYILILFPACEV